MRVATFIINKLMPFWIVVAAILGYVFPDTFIRMSHYSVYYLGAVILLMSLTLSVESFVQVFRRPKALLLGFAIKWLTTPLLATIAAHLVFSSQPLLAAGTILDGAVPAGASSNLFTFLAHGSVELAVSLTFLHTILSPILTPSFTTLFVGKYVAVSFVAMMLQLLELVIVPVALGLVCRRLIGARRIAKVQPVFPMVSAMLLYCLTIGLFAAAEPAIVKNLRWIPITGLTMGVLCAVNLAIAYALARLFRLEAAAARAILFDVGVYNSGLGAVLASVNFGAFAAIPALMNAILNLLIGSGVASYLQARPIQDSPDIAKAGAMTRARSATAFESSRARISSTTTGN